MNWISEVACLRAIIIIAIIFGSIIITCFAMFFNYNAKLNKEGIEIVKLKNFKKEVEEKNGKEQHEIEELKITRQEDRKIIDDLQKEVKELKSRN